MLKIDSINFLALVDEGMGNHWVWLLCIIDTNNLSNKWTLTAYMVRTYIHIFKLGILPSKPYLMMHGASWLSSYSSPQALWI